MTIPHADWDSPCLKKLDALDWIFGFCVDFDNRFLGVRCDCEEAGKQLRCVAQEFGKIVQGGPCESLISVRTAKPSKRRGVRHFNVLYSNHDAITKSFDLDDILLVFQDMLKLGAVTLTDRLVHIQGSRLFAWEADDRLISIVGPEKAALAAVVALRPFLMPARTSYTALAENGSVPFGPWDLNWRGRLIHQPLPLTDLVFLLEPSQGPVGKGEAVLRLYELSSGKLLPAERMRVLVQALNSVRIHSVPIEDSKDLGQRVSDALGLGVEARHLPEDFHASLT